MHRTAEGEKESTAVTLKKVAIRGLQDVSCNVTVAGRIVWPLPLIEWPTPASRDDALLFKYII
jgi:hypothetical protein